MEEEINKLRQAGFSDEDIRAYMEEQKSSSNSTAPAPVSPEQSADTPIRVDETVPDYGGTTETSFGETLGTVGAAVAPYALPVAIGGAGLYGASTLKSGFDAMKESAAARTAQANAQMKMAEGIQQRFDARQTSQMSKTAPTYNVPTTTAPAPTYNVPTTTAPAAPQSRLGVVDQASNIVRKLALSKLLPAAQVGMGLFYTSPEEIATLKAAEELRKKQGLKR